MQVQTPRFPKWKSFEVAFGELAFGRGRQAPSSLVARLVGRDLSAHSKKWKALRRPRSNIRSVAPVGVRGTAVGVKQRRAGATDLPERRAVATEQREQRRAVPAATEHREHRTVAIEHRDHRTVAMEHREEPKENLLAAVARDGAVLPTHPTSHR